MSNLFLNPKASEAETLAKGMEKLLTNLFDPHNGLSASQTGIEETVRHIIKNKVGQITQEEEKQFFQELHRIKERIDDFNNEDNQKIRKLIEKKPEEAEDADEKPHYLPKDQVAKRYNLDIFLDDINRLQPAQWLNDRLINFYVYYLTEKNDARQTSKQSTAITSLYFSILGKGSIDEKNMNIDGASQVLQRRAEMVVSDKRFIFEVFSRVFFVCNIENSHWVLVECRVSQLNSVVSAGSMKIQTTKNIKIQQPMAKSTYAKEPEKARVTLILYDSLVAAQPYPEDNKVLKMIKKAVQREYEKNGQNLTSTDVLLQYGPPIRQRNFSDCGVYVCKYLECLYDKGQKENDVKITDGDIDKMRKDLEKLIKSIGFKKDLPKDLPL